MIYKSNCLISHWEFPFFFWLTFTLHKAPSPSIKDSNYLVEKLIGDRISNQDLSLNEELNVKFNLPVSLLQIHLQKSIYKICCFHLTCGGEILNIHIANCIKQFVWTYIFKTISMKQSTSCELDLLNKS